MSVAKLLFPVLIVFAPLPLLAQEAGTADGSAAETSAAEGCAGLSITMTNGEAACITGLTQTLVAEEIEPVVLPILSVGEVKPADEWKDSDSIACAATGGTPTVVTGERILCAPE